MNLVMLWQIPDVGQLSGCMAIKALQGSWLGNHQYNNLHRVYNVLLQRETTNLGL